MATKEFKLICMRTLCDQKVFSVWKDDADQRGTNCPKCGHTAGLVRVPESEPAISPNGENNEDTMLMNLEELQNV